MALFQVKTEHDPGAQGTLRLKRSQLVDMQRPQPETHWQGWHWVNEDGQAGWVPELLLGRVDAQRARVLEDYDHELHYPRAAALFPCASYAGWHYGNLRLKQCGWAGSDENLEKPALQAEKRRKAVWQHCAPPRLGRCLSSGRIGLYSLPVWACKVIFTPARR